MKAPCTRLALACLWAVWWFGSGVAVSQQTADRDFQATVVDPAYKDLHPKVLFDEAHFNVHTTRGSYKTFVDLVTSDGYQATATDKFCVFLLAGQPQQFVQHLGQPAKVSRLHGQGIPFG